MVEKYVGYKIGFTPGVKDRMIDPETGESLDSKDFYWLAYYGDWVFSKRKGSERLVFSGTEFFDDFPSLFVGLVDMVMDEDLEMRIAFDRKSKHLIPESEQDLVKGVIRFYNSRVKSKN